MSGRLAEWLKLHGYRVNEIADWLGISRNTASSRLSGKSEWKVGELMVVAQRTRMTGSQFRWILEGVKDDE